MEHLSPTQSAGFVFMVDCGIYIFSLKESATKEHPITVIEYEFILFWSSQPESMSKQHLSRCEYRFRFIELKS